MQGCLTLALDEMAHTGEARKGLLRVQAGMSVTWADWIEKRGHESLGLTQLVCACRLRCLSLGT